MSLNLDKKEDKLLILLLMGNSNRKTNLYRRYFGHCDKNTAKSRSSSIKQSYENLLEGNLIAEEEIEPRGLGNPPTKTEPEWVEISSRLWEDVPRDIKNIDELAQDLANKFQNDREIIFNEEALKSLYYMNGEYIFPSLQGFILTAIGYTCVLEDCLRLIDSGQAEGMEEALSKLPDHSSGSLAPSLSPNIRFIVRRVWKGLAREKSLDYDTEFYRRELEMLQIMEEVYRSKYDEVTYIWENFWVYLKEVQGVIVKVDFDVSEGDYTEENYVEALNDIKSGKIEGDIQKETNQMPLFRGIKVEITDSEAENIESGGRELHKSAQGIREMDDWLELIELFR